jgi:predicted MFS family arabinose efflux permease
MCIFHFTFFLKMVILKTIQKGVIKMGDALNDRKNFFHIAGSGAAIIAVTYGLCRYSYGLFIPDIQHTFGLSVEWLGIIGSSSYIGYLIATLITGIFTKKFGPKIPLFIGGVCAVVGSLLIACSVNSLILFIGVCIAGMSPGFAFPPMSEYVVIKLAKDKKDKAISIINSGTSIGIVLAAPFVLFLGVHWRTAWLIFALISLLVLIWNFKMSSMKSDSSENFKIDNEKTTVIKYDQKLIKLIISMLLSGIVFAAFWTYSVDYIDLSSKISFFTFSLKSTFFSEIFWIVVGGSGLLSVYAYKIINRYGLRNVFQGALILVAVATLILAIFPSNGILLLIAGFLFGIGFQLFAAFSLIWGINILKEAAAFASGLVLLAMSVGLLLGPIIFAPVIHCYSMCVVFYIAGIFGIIISFIKPGKNIKA